MKQLTIISGVPPSLAVGAGRLVRHLLLETLTWGPSVYFIYAGSKCDAAVAYRSKRFFNFFFHVSLHYIRKIKLKLSLTKLVKCSDVVLIHTQEIGVKWCREFIEKRDKPIWVYVLDSSYFCVRSYNHLPGATDACLLCIGGKYENIDKNHCKPFPVDNQKTVDFLRFLDPMVVSGKVRLLAQNERNAQLMRRHYGPNAIVKVIGLWTSDMNDLFERPRENTVHDSPYDVVFHGDAKEAKGLHWALGLARICPEYTFLFPCGEPTNYALTSNCVFLPMRWETGLRDAIQNSKLTLAPSLWSAPIEGALVKSILHAKRVAVVSVETSYSSELSANLVCHLPQDYNQAADVLKERLAAPPTPYKTIRNWFLAERKAARLVQNIAAAV